MFLASALMSERFQEVFAWGVENVNFRILIGASTRFDVTQELISKS
jgi:hypothetical protein